MYPAREGKLRLVVLVGPTAVGKTEISLHLAERMNGEIISADSRLFYRGMNIGTAKPSPDELARIRHHLVDVAEPDETWSLSQFQQAVHAAVVEIHQRGKIPFLVGGTGQYVRAITQGWQTPEVSPNPDLRAALEDWAGRVGKDGLYDRLVKLDPQAADKIDPRNLRRTIRALEVIFSTGRRFSELRSAEPPPYNLLILGLTRPRPELYRRIDARIGGMIAHGWVEEVRALLNQGYASDLSSFSAIGYRELANVIYGKISLEEAITIIRRQSRIYVRRQANWFKLDDPQIHWFEARTEAEEEAAILIRGWLDHED